MNTKLFTHDLQTGDITVMSNVTSVTVNATRISRVEEIPGHEQENPSAIHVDFEVKQPSRLPTVLEGTEELGLIFNLDDAVELGLLLVSMGMEHKSADDLAGVISRLMKLIKDFESVQP